LTSGHAAEIVLQDDLLKEIAVKSILALVVVALFALGGSPSQAKEWEVTVVNGTGYPIKFLGFNPPGDNDWSENELEGVLQDGESVDVSFDDEEDDCKWNIRVDWADPGYPGVLWRNVDVCNITKITLHYNRSTDTTSISTR
jgi:hypothetical protein